MKKFFKIVVILGLLLMLNYIWQGDLQAQVGHNDVIINEYIVNPTVGFEWVELLVVKSGGVDLRGFRLSDVSSKGGAGGLTEGHLDFPNESYLQNLQQGTRIICVGSRPVPATLQFVQDTDPSDGLLILLADTLAGGTGVLTRVNVFDIATNDNIELLDGPTSGASTIDFVANGTNNSSGNFSDATWVQTGSPSLTNNTVQYFRNSSNCTLNNDTAALGWQWNQSIVDITPGNKNLGQNFPWDPPNDGDGSATLANTGGGTFNGSTIFSRNASGQTVTVTIYGTDCGLLESVRLTVPSSWGGYNTSNVSVGGAFTGKTPSFSGNDITITGLSLSSTPGTITITNLTSPNHVGAGVSGNDTWVVKTAKSGGVLTEIGVSPVSHTIIPISNLRQGGVDGYGNSDAEGTIPVLNGMIVAVTGTITVENYTLADSTYTSIFIQDNGYGLQIFKSVTNTYQTLRLGDSIVVKGSVTSYGGNTEVIPISVTAPNLFEIGTVPVPEPLILSDASQISEANEGKLVKLNSVSWDSAGSGNTFIVSAINRGRNNFDAGTGTMYLASVNKIVGVLIPATSPITGVVYHTTGLYGGGQQLWKIAPRGKNDLGLPPEDGSGTATISPVVQVSNATPVTETLVLKGDGANTIAGMSVTIPSDWQWTGNSAHVSISGPGFASATKTVTGVGSSVDPWVITLNSTAVTFVDTGIIEISNLTTPSSFGTTTFIVKTRGASGSLTPISSHPTVTITPTFPFIENFDYTPGSYLTDNNWTAHSGTANPISVNETPLEYSSYVQSNIGKSVTLTTYGQDINRAFLTVNNGTVYASFMVRVDTALTSPEYFFHLSPFGNPTNHIARVYFKMNATNQVSFGVGKGSTDSVFTPYSYSLGSTYLIALGYKFNTGTNTDDELKLWINPPLVGMEPTADLTLTGSTTDPSTLGTVALRQGSGNSTPAVVLGGLRIDTNWIPSGATGQSISVASGWNMLSLPFVVTDYRKSVLFPSAISNAFYYDVSYKKADTLKNGVGYWLKFANAEVLQITGVGILSDSIDVVEGWNMIGSVNKPVRTLDITSEPADIVKSYYFGYLNSYYPTDSIRPGKGYWVKTSSAGKLYLSATGLLSKTELSPKDVLEQLESITITDKNGNSQTLYFGNAEKNIDVTRFELPPSTPGEFDVRFASKRMVEVLPEKIEKPQALPINVKSSAYPLTISWKVKNNGTYILKDGANLKQSLVGEGKLVLSKPVNSLFIEASNKGDIPTEFALSANYPNPFNPSTKFVLSVPKNAVVEVVIYDILGRKVRSLMNEELEAGYHTVEWNGLTDDNTIAPSGVYFVRMISDKFNSVRKIMMMK